MFAGFGGAVGAVEDKTEGVVSFKITDDPACGYDAVNITIEKLRVHASSTAADGDAGWYEVPVVPTRFDLLKLSNGAVETLGQSSHARAGLSVSGVDHHILFS